MSKTEVLIIMATTIRGDSEGDRTITGVVINSCFLKGVCILDLVAVEEAEKRAGSTTLLQKEVIITPEEGGQLSLKW